MQLGASCMYVCTESPAVIFISRNVAGQEIRAGLHCIAGAPLFAYSYTKGSCQTCQSKQGVSVANRDMILYCLIQLRLGKPPEQPLLCVPPPHVCATCRMMENLRRRLLNLDRG